jgi:hypothetical protein
MPTARARIVASGLLLSGLAAGCSADDVRTEQAEALQATCVSMIERAFPDEPGLARDALRRNKRAFLLPEGSSRQLRPVDVLVANCVAQHPGFP